LKQAKLIIDTLESLRVIFRTRRFILNVNRPCVEILQKRTITIIYFQTMWYEEKLHGKPKRRRKEPKMTKPEHSPMRKRKGNAYYAGDRITRKDIAGLIFYGLVALAMLIFIAYEVYNWRSKDGDFMGLEVEPADSSLFREEREE